MEQRGKSSVIQDPEAGEKAGSEHRSSYVCRWDRQAVN